MHLLIQIALLYWFACIPSKSTDLSSIEGLEEDSGMEMVPEETSIGTLEEWLLNHPELSTDLLRRDLLGGSFGGYESPQDTITHTPIVFVHGNSDRAIGGDLGGWQELRAQFLAHGYTNAELYGTTYGSGEASDSSQYTHREEFVLQVRKHLEAVLAYTGASKIHVISHSLGVTMARQAILGGEGVNDDGSQFVIGASLEEQVSIFIGIAGANQGLAQCYGSFSPVCSSTNGLYPGTWNGLEVLGVAQVLENLNAQEHYEGDKIYSIWSDVDEILGYQCLVWGANSCQIPGQDDEASFAELGHFALRDETFDVIYDWIVTSE